MNGSGNLLVACTATDGGPSTLELHFGNASFDGARTYVADDFTSDGSVLYDEGTRSQSYSSIAKGASCTLVLTEASLDASGSSAIRGSRIAGTFTCTAIVGSAKSVPLSYVLEAGELAAVIE